MPRPMRTAPDARLPAPTRAPSLARRLRRGPGLVSLVLLAACGGGELSVSPGSLEFGVVDFSDPEAMPTEGYVSTELVIENTGKGTVTAELTEIDLERLCVPGFGTTPAKIDDLEEGQRFSIFVGVCDYDEEVGRDVEAKGEIVIGGEGVDEPVVVPWSFTPTASQDI